MTNKPDSRRIGSFAIEEELGADELGAWFKARDERLDRTVALRVWRMRGPRAELRPAIRARARAAAAVAHPSLPTVFGREEVGVTDLLSVELVEGESLADVLRSGRRWRPLDAARLVVPIADAVAVAHAAGVAHGAIGPEHIRLRADGRPVLLGLGVARSAAEAERSYSDDGARREDVRALAHLVRDLCDVPVANGGRRGADPLLTVEMNLLEPVLQDASRPRSRKLPDAASLRDALIGVTTAGGRAAAPRRATPPPTAAPAAPFLDQPVSHKSAQSPPHRTNAAPLMLGEGDFDDVDDRFPGGPGGRTLMEPPANPSVLIPDGRSFGGRHRGRNLAAALVLGALVAFAAVAAYRWGLLASDDSVLPESPIAMVDPEENGPVAPRESAATPSFADEVATDPEPADTPLVVAGAPEIDVEPEPEPAESPPVTPPPPPPAAETPAPASTASRTATVSVTPADAIISRVSDGAFLGMGGAEVSVPRGDSMRIALNRQGYVAEERTFTGAPLSVRLRPDSVNVTFMSNIPVEVVLDTPEGQRVLGTTNLEARLPTGEYRVHYRSQSHDEWSVLADFARAGSSYRVTKMDYATRGAVVIAVDGGWARVSLNGGPERETPARFDDLPDAPHIIRLSREGYETIVDTIIITPGQVTTRRYQLRPAR